METYRYGGHYYGDPQVYRTKDEIEAWRAATRDPLLIARDWMLQDALATEADLERIDGGVDDAIEAGVKFADASPLATAIRLPDDVYAT